MKFRRWLVLAALVAADPACAASARALEEAQARTRLAAVRERIEALSAQRAEVAGERDASVARLRAIETEVGASARRLRDLRARIVDQERKLAERVAEREVIEQRLSGQRERLAALLRSAHLIGHGESLRAFLARDRIADSQRALAYHRYLQRDRVGQVQRLMQELEELLAIERVIAQNRDQLAAQQAAAEREAARLTEERISREALLAEFNTRLKQEDSAINALARDEQDLLDLLDALRDIFADIPKQLAEALPLSQQRGTLVRPHPGKVLVAFGGDIAPGRSSEGWLFEAEVGDDVQAVAGGRVAFADWLKGFGLLLILDHGDGYLSLYAQNESLLHDVGDWVKSGDVIATAGASGGAGSAGVYVELRHQGRPVDPKGWFRKP